MEFFKNIKSKLLSVRQAWNSTGDNKISDNKISMRRIMDLFSGSHNYDLGSDLSEVTFFSCLKILSESIGKMPCYLIDSDKRRVTSHDTIWFLTVKPNEFMTPAQFFTYLEFNRNYYGNAYVYVNRDGDGNIEGFYPLDSRRVQIWINNSDVFTSRAFYYFYTDSQTGKSYYFEPKDILHFKSWLTDDSGLAGKSVREILATSFTGAKSSTKFLNNLYGQGLIANAVVKYTGDLKRESQDRLLDEIIAQAEDKGRRMITLPTGFDIQKLDLSLADSQFFELKKYTARQIAAAFGVNTFYLNDLEKSSYANASMQNTQFYTSTLLFILNLYEQEMNKKLLTREEMLHGLGFKFNVAVLLRGDISQQADIVQKLLSCGVYSVNEARRLLDRESCDGGDVRFVNGSYVKLEDIGKAYEKAGDENDNSQE